LPDRGARAQAQAGAPVRQPRGGGVLACGPARAQPYRARSETQVRGPGAPSARGRSAGHLERVQAPPPVQGPGGLKAPKAALNPEGNTIEAAPGPFPRVLLWKHRAYSVRPMHPCPLDGGRDNGGVESMVLRTRRKL